MLGARHGCLQLRLQVLVLVAELTELHVELSTLQHRFRCQLLGGQPRPADQPAMVRALGEAAPTRQACVPPTLRQCGSAAPLDCIARSCKRP